MSFLKLKFIKSDCLKTTKSYQKKIYVFYKQDYKPHHYKCMNQFTIIILLHKYIERSYEK